MNRRLTLLAAFIAATAALPAFANDYPSRPIELIVPYNAGGGTDALARAFADVARKHLSQPIVVNNKPGASGVIGWTDVLNSKPDGYKLALMTVELTTLPHLGLQKFSHEEFTPIARMNADPAAITVRAESPWNNIEEFIAAAKKANGEMKMGNSGNGSIWHLAAAALEDRTGTQYSHIPYPGANPAVLSLLGGHIDAVSVSPAEVAPHVASGKLKILAVMADQRQKGFEKVPTFKERGIDLLVGTWRGLGAPKSTPKDVIEILKVATQKTMQEQAMKDAMEKLALGYAYGDDATFKAVMARDNETFKTLIPKLGLKN
ncbi:MAG TPA: tripartite tricarboxylate transporter substrate binding protein [Rhizobacter sp.]|nr:tripartite tricarboxylate transporter substrate binding protein [Rhizobacter sp.]